MIPQIIYLAIVGFNIGMAFYLHGKERKGRHDVAQALLGIFLQVLIMYFGGFFNPMIK